MICNLFSLSSIIKHNNDQRLYKITHSTCIGYFRKTQNIIKSIKKYHRNHTTICATWRKHSCRPTVNLKQPRNGCHAHASLGDFEGLPGGFWKFPETKNQWNFSAEKSPNHTTYHVKSYNLI